jgi:hypothetical protein
MLKNALKLKTKLLFFIITCTALCNASAFAQQKSASNVEDEAKVLEYIINNIIWPSNANSTTLNLCVLGNSPLDAFNLVHGKNINKQVIQTHAINDVQSNNCQIIFVSKSEKNNVKQILEDVNGKPILTISDLSDFAQQGGGVNLFMANNQPALMLNTFAIRSQALEISKSMLKILTIIPDVEAEPETSDSAE